MSSFEKKMVVLGWVLNLVRKKPRSIITEREAAMAQSIVIINNKRLGDFLFCTPAIRALREKNPSAKITVITSQQNSDLIGDNPYIDEVLFMGDSFKEAIRMGKILRTMKPDLGIIFHSKLPYDIIALTVADTKCILKHYFGNEKKVLIDVCDAVVIGGEKPPVMNDLELIEKIGITNNNTEMFFPYPLPPKKTESLSVGIQLGASGKNRFFPEEVAVDMVSEINATYPGCEFHLIGSTQEKSLGESFTQKINENCKARLTNHIGATSISQLAEIINNFTVLVTPDTGCLHIATALKTKTVSLFLIRSPGASIPQQDNANHHVLYASDYADFSNIKEGESALKCIPTREIIDGVLYMMTSGLS
ncbi:glycosyltransferase family 9 protein [Erwinia sp. ErVv1]|uniref:glycosyltransferase family 9 protein n=1 Tax=Erwinia sp. ErVv1 TaxID=1603299 RepID=UPI00082B50DA|nr:glycosyltransferase family 9 protein [Erwinia sp. ErVv1]